MSVIYDTKGSPRSEPFVVYELSIFNYSLSISLSLEWVLIESVEDG